MAKQIIRKLIRGAKNRIKEQKLLEIKDLIRYTQEQIHEESNKQANQLQKVKAELDRLKQDNAKLQEKINEITETQNWAEAHLEEIKHLAKRSNRRQASYFGKDRIISWNLDNLLLVANAPDLGFPANLVRDGAYEEDNYQIINHLYEASRPFLDIGANCGIFSARIGNSLRRSKTKVYAFEPNPEMHELCRINFFNNGLENCIAIQAAASSEEGKAILTFNKHHTGGATLSKENPNEQQSIVEVDTISIDTFLESHAISNPSFVKIDVEGHEGSVIAGMKKIIQAQSNNRESFGILFENFSIDTPAALSEALAETIRLGYSLFHVAGRCKLKQIAPNELENHQGYLLLANKHLTQKRLRESRKDEASEAKVFSCASKQIPLESMQLTQYSECITKGQDKLAKIAISKPWTSRETEEIAVHGPYINLRQGNYKLRINASSIKGLDVRLQHDLGYRILFSEAKKEHNHRTGDFFFKFTLKEYTTEFEIVLSCKTHCHCYIHEIEIIDIN